MHESLPAPKNLLTCFHNGEIYVNFSHFFVKKPRDRTTIPTFPVKENSFFVFSYLLPKNSIFSLELHKNFPKNLAGLQIVLSFA
jgi:hypothetical protein